MKSLAQFFSSSPPKAGVPDEFKILREIEALAPEARQLLIEELLRSALYEFDALTVRTASPEVVALGEAKHPCLLARTAAYARGLKSAALGEPEPLVNLSSHSSVEFHAGWGRGKAELAMKEVARVHRIQVRTPAAS